MCQLGGQRNSDFCRYLISGCDVVSATHGAPSERNNWKAGQEFEMPSTARLPRTQNPSCVKSTFHLISQVWPSAAGPLRL